MPFNCGLMYDSNHYSANPFVGHSFTWRHKLHEMLDRHPILSFAGRASREIHSFCFYPQKPRDWKLGTQSLLDGGRPFLYLFVGSKATHLESQLDGRY